MLLVPTGLLGESASVCGLARVEGRTFSFIGHQKGRNTTVCCFRLLQHAGPCPC